MLATCWHPAQKHMYELPYCISPCHTRSQVNTYSLQFFQLLSIIGADTHARTPQTEQNFIITYINKYFFTVPEIIQ